jgi:BirA family biotin operon repressor/biotin-[acetyl-CoA-carboxylase] ligase
LYNITSNTLFTGNQIIYLKECQSTNDVLAELSKQATVFEGAIVITDHQLGGRGQRGNVWEANPGDNLTLSLLYKPFFVQVQFPFGLNIAVSLGIFDVLNEYLPQKVKIKWPNDMIVSVNGVDKKICGILMENTIKKNQFENAIIGIGINVNQTNFKESKATSLTEYLHVPVDKNEVLNKLCSRIESRYLALKNNKNLTDEYITHLYLLYEKALFCVDEVVFEGIIQGVDVHGRLAVLHLHANKLHQYSFGEIRYLGRV